MQKKILQSELVSISIICSMILFAPETHAYVIKSSSSGFSINDILELCGYGIGVGIVTIIIGIFTEVITIKDIGMRIIIFSISPIVLFIAIALIGFIAEQFNL